jgi:hypothetical protein
MTCALAQTRFQMQDDLVLVACSSNPGLHLQLAAYSFMKPGSEAYR